MSKARNLKLYSFYLLCIIPLFFVRDYTTANELRYLSIIDEALKNNSFFTFYNHGTIYADKPPMYFWLLMLCRWLAGNHYLWLYGLFSIIPAIITTRIFSIWTKPIVPVKWQVGSQAMLLTTGLFLAMTLSLRMDMLMCMFIVLALWEAWKLIENAENHIHQWLFGLYVFLAVFTKGPYGILIPLVSTVSYCLIIKNPGLIIKIWNWRCLLLLILFCSLWFGGVYFEGGSEYINDLLFHQTMGRAVKSFHHSEPFYYYFLCIWYCLFPWTFVIIGLIITSLLKPAKPKGILLYFLTITLASIILLSCVSSKIEIYLLPVVPFIVFSCIISLNYYESNKWINIGYIATSIVYVLIFPIFLFLRFNQEIPEISTPYIWMPFLCVTTAGMISLYYLFSNRYKNKIIYSTYCLSGGILLCVLTLSLSMEHLNKYIGYKDLYKEIKTKSCRTGIQKIKSWHVGRSENMDVYDSNFVIEDITDEDYFPLHLTDSIQEPYILVTKLKKLEKLNGKKADITGKYCIIEMRQ